VKIEENLTIRTSRVPTGEPEPIEDPGQSEEKLPHQTVPDNLTSLHQ